MLLGLRFDPLHELIDGGSSHGGELLQPIRAQHVLNHVASQGSPHGTVHGGMDGDIARAEDFPGRSFDGPGCELGPALDQGLVREIRVGDDDHGSDSHLERENRAVGFFHLVYVFEKLLTGARELKQITDYRPARWARWEVHALLRLVTYSRDCINKNGYEK